MKKQLISLAVTTALFNAATLADTLTTPVETIQVTANRSLDDKFALLASYDLISREQINQLQANSVPEILQQLAGFSVSQQGGATHNTSLIVRGGNSDHLLILVDGVRVGSASLGIKNVGEIPVELIDSIEVVRGPRAALWGSDAISGVINIKTRQLASNEHQLSASFGSHQHWQTSVAKGLGNAEHHYTVTALAEASSGFDVIKPSADNPYAIDQADNDGFNRQALGLSGRSQLSSQLDLALNGQYSQGLTEIDASFGGDETRYQNYHLAGDLIWRANDDTVVTTKLARSQDDNKDNNDTKGGIKNRYKTARDQFDLIGQYQLNNTEFVAGFNWYQEQLHSHQAYAKTSRVAQGYFVTARHLLDQLQLEAALRHDSVGDSPSENSFNLALGYQVNNNWLVSLSRASGFKAPTFNDLYWPEAFGSSANPDLVAETSLNTEVFVKYQGEQLQASVSLYQNNIDNLIEWAPVDANDPFSAWQPSNVQQAKIKGAEFSVSYQLADLTQQVTFTHLDAKNTLTNTQLALRPYFTANYQADYQLDALSLGLNINYQGKRYDSLGALPSHTVVNLLVSYAYSSQLTISGKIANLADKYYQQVREYPGDARNYQVTVDYRF